MWREETSWSDIRCLIELQYATTPIVIKKKSILNQFVSATCAFMPLFFPLECVFSVASAICPVDIPHPLGR